MSGTVICQQVAPGDAKVVDFGLSCARLHIDPKAARFPDDLVFDACCLLENALEVFNLVSDSGNVPDGLFAGLYLLRQGLGVLGVVQVQSMRAAAAVSEPGHGAGSLGTQDTEVPQ